MRWKKILPVPCFLSVAYVPLAIGLDRLFGDWGMLPLNAITFPASILFQLLDDKISNRILYGTPPPITAQQYALANSMTLYIYIVGGALWYFCLGLAYVIFINKGIENVDKK